MNRKNKKEPLHGLSGKETVKEMFNSISSRYDFLNHFFSFHIDRYWRRKAVDALKPYTPRDILDVATGTGDFAIALASLHPEKITGIDVAEEMLAIGRRKIRKKKLDRLITLMQGDAGKMDFPSHTFDAVTVAFGVRNFENLLQGLKEIYRVLKPGGTLVILEFSQPPGGWFRRLYYAYFNRVVPLLGSLISGNKQAYHYLPQSVMAFPSPVEFTEYLNQAGFSETRFSPLTGGIVTLYLSKK